MIKEMFQGFCMAMADSVPGVSGGTIAFLMGFYNQFITSLNNLTTRDKAKRKMALTFLGKLMAGWVIGMGLAASVLATVFSTQIYAVSSLFLGFIVVAVILLIANNFSGLKLNAVNFICLVVGIVVVVAVTMLNGAISSGMDLADLSIGQAVYLFIAAMIAISAMVLPGISGSTLLLVFGLYLPIITAIKSFMHFDMSVLPALMIFSCGVLTGIVLFVRWIKLALDTFPAQTMYTIIGLMIGSLYAIAMGPTTLKVPQPPMSMDTFSPLFFVVGIVLVLAMEWYRYMQEKNSLR